MSEIKIDLTLCIICQKKLTKNEHLATAKDKGITALERSVISRKTKEGVTFRDAIARIESLSKGCEVKYHSSCKATFTSISLIARLPDRINDHNLQRNTNVAINEEGLTSEALTSVQQTDWTKCIFCQHVTAEHLRKVRSASMDATIKDLGSVDDQLRARISNGMINLVNLATYHLNCLNEYQALLLKSTAPQESQNIALSTLISELRSDASKGKVLKLSHVWERFLKLAVECDEIVPESFKSRRSTFKDKLSKELYDVYDFYQPLDRDINERQMLLIPIKFKNKLIADHYLNQEDFQLPTCERGFEDSKRNIIYSALKIHHDLKSRDGHIGFNVSLESAKNVVPKSLLLHLGVLIHGHDGIENFLDEEGELSDNIDDESDNDSEDEDDDSENDDESDDHYVKGNASYKIRMLSIAQDIVYAASKGKKLTPKHIGLAVTVHQKVRKKAKKIINLLNSAGHCISYRQLLQVDTTLAELTLDTLDYETGAVIPPNLIPYPSENQLGDSVLNQQMVCPFLQVTADNIDKITDTLDGKNSFHATQMVVFQRGGISSDNVLNSLKMKQRLSLQVPEVLGKVFEPDTPPREEPVLTDAANLDWYSIETKSESVKGAESKDLAFIISRQSKPDNEKMGWTEYNKMMSTNNSGITSSTFMPLIIYPAHEYDTLNTVLKRCITLGDRLNYKYIVLTVDQALHCKLLELIWSSEIYRKRIILRMGGLHISMNYLKAIGQHMTDSGLADIWIESGVLGVGSVQKVLSGKAYSKGMRVHKLTYQALWRILMPRFMEFLDKSHKEMYEKLKDFDGNNKDLSDFLELEEQRKVFNAFIAQESERDPNSKFWLMYIDMISTLLKFTRSMRDGEWDLDLGALNEMLPLLARYDHFKYLQSLSAYIYDMNHLPDDVLCAFRNGEFVIKKTESKFNQVDPDHAQEWLVGTCKDTGGIIAITNKDKTMHKWILSFHWKTEISQKTLSMFGIKSHYSVEVSKGRLKRDQRDENSILQILNEFGVLSSESQSKYLQNVVTKDLATEEIQTSLLNAIEYGKQQVVEYIKERFIPDDKGKPEKSFVGYTKNMPLTMADLKKQLPTKPSLKNIAKNGTNILQRLVMAYESGQPIDLLNILKHELQGVPLSIADVNGELRPGDDSAFTEMLSKGVPLSTSINSGKSESHLIIDAEKIILSLGTLANATSFGDLADLFMKRITTLALSYRRIDLLFSRYNIKSIKHGNAKPALASVRRVIQNERVPLPKNFKHYWANDENKADLAQFLSRIISNHNHENTDIIVSGGFKNQTEVFSSNENIDVERLQATHELAVTRIILHTVNSSSKTVVVSTSDSNAYVLLIRYFDKFECKELWLETTTRKKTQFLPIHTISTQLSSEVKSNLLIYNAILGCYTTSYLNGITKSGNWITYEKHSELLSGFRIDSFENAKQAAEHFIVKLYKVEQGADTVDLARYILFRKMKQLDKLPPTSDALEHHLKRAFYQSTVWENAHLSNPTSLLPEHYGWILNESGNYKPVLMTLEPFTAKCLEATHCGCKTNCSSGNCKCRRSKAPCTAMCNCVILTCKNPFKVLKQNGINMDSCEKEA